MSRMGLAGIASGVDTNAIVDQLMAIERNKIARHNLRTRGMEAEASGLRDVQARLKPLKSAAEALRSPALWANTQTVESSNSARLNYSNSVIRRVHGPDGDGATGYVRLG